MRNPLGYLVVFDDYQACYQRSAGETVDGEMRDCSLVFLLCRVRGLEDEDGLREE